MTNLPRLERLVAGGEELRVEQCDRDVAADYLQTHDFLRAGDIRSGKLDHHSAVQAFARHRADALRNEIEPILAEMKRLREGLEPFAAACTVSTADDADHIDDTLAAAKITWADLRRARTALSGDGA